jgi:hypothetical protein
MMNQIEDCRRYAREHDRMLYIDGRESGFQDSLHTYFLPPRGSYGPKAGMEFRVMPSGLSKRLTVTKINDLRTAHDEECLLWERDGGGTRSHYAMRWLRLTPAVRAEIKAAVASLNGLSYCALHVRNTDYRTDYRSFFAQVRDRLDAQLALCTDDSRVVRYAYEMFGDRVVWATRLPDSNGGGAGAPAPDERRGAPEPEHRRPGRSARALWFVATVRNKRYEP